MPTWDQFMIPALEVLSDGEIRTRPEIFDLVATKTQLTEDQRNETLDSRGFRYENRIGCSINDLVKANAVKRPYRGNYSISESGRKLLADPQNAMTKADLDLIDGYKGGWE